MPVFTYQFTVNAPLTAVRDFHQDTSALKKLTPPPLWAQIHTFEPMAEGSKADFTLWFGPVPVRWQAVHFNITDNGFTDRQERGPLNSWQHTHRFTAVNHTTTRVKDQIQYEYPAGWRGLFCRLLFNKPGLTVLFTGRKLLTRHHIKKLTRVTPTP